MPIVPPPLARLAPELVVLFGLASGLRLYHIAEYTTFQGDQGIDALAAKRLLVDHVLPVEGPATSAGGVHLGPLYYYLLALPMLIVWLDPLADAVGVALLGALATALLYVLARVWFGRLAAGVAATLFAISPGLIEAARSAWNPAPGPFFVLVALVGLEGFRDQRRGRWLVVVGCALGCIVQFHYFNVGLVLALLAAEAWLLLGSASRPAVGWGLFGLALGAALLAPLLVHEIGNGYPNLHAAAAVLGHPGSGAESVSLPRRVYAVLTSVFVGGYMTSGVEPLAVVLTLVLIIALGLAVRAKQTRFGPALIASGLCAGLAQAVIYRGPIPQHYLLAYTPLAYLAVAAAVAFLPRGRGAHYAAGLGLLVVLVVNATHAPFGQPDRQLWRAESAAAAIDSASGGKPYALRLLANDDTDGAYRFELERIGNPPVRPDETPPDQAFVVCQATPCDRVAVQALAGPEWDASRGEWQTSLADVQIVRLAAMPRH